MDIYSRKLGEGCFTYVGDWGGFNVPSKMITACYENDIKDLNFYDDIIKEVHSQITDEEYYLIGSTGNDKETLKHETIHALFYLNENYRKEVISIIKEISTKSYNDMKTYLLTIGYALKVMDDEINAYLTAGDGSLWEGIKVTKKLRGTAKKLQSLFEQYEKINNKGY
jgi:hypothetical protein